MKSPTLALKLKHMELVQQGKYEVAGKLYELLLTGHVCLSLGNIDWEADRICESLDCKPSISGSWGHAIYNIKKRR